VSETTTKPVAPFIQTLSHLERGGLNDELTEELAAVVKAVRDSGKKGEVTLKLNVALMKGTEDTVIIGSTVTAKVPQLDRPSTIMFSTFDGDLLRDDPRQISMDLKTVASKPVQELKQVGAK
tara:strand:+ start:192070 stop:192435 length:366 start_codon:yes stop_codon:yes gene_type:complete